MQLRNMSGSGVNLAAAVITLFVILGSSTPAAAAVLFRSKADDFSSIADASRVWYRIEGAVALSGNYTHGGKQSYQLSYAGNEAQSFLAIQVAPGTKRVFLRWWEVRERAGDFAGAKDYDWSGEKAIRFRSSTIGSTGVDYCLGWEASSGFIGTSGTDGPGQFVFFGNSTASNGKDHLRVAPNIQRGQWNMYEVEVNLGTRGQANGAVRIWVNDVLLGQASGLNLLPSTDASIEEIWVGGWYSGLSPNPSPARRYIDDVVLSDSKIGFDGSSPPPPVPAAPNPFIVQ